MSDNDHKVRPDLETGTSYPSGVPTVPFGKKQPRKAPELEAGEAGAALAERVSRAAEVEASSVKDESGNPWQGSARRAFHTAQFEPEDDEDGEGEEAAEDRSEPEEDEAEEAAPPAEDGEAEEEDEEVEESAPEETSPGDSLAALEEYANRVERERSEAKPQRGFASAAPSEDVPARKKSAGDEVSVSELAVVSRPAFEAHSLLSRALAPREPAMQVALTQSCYHCELTAMTLAEIHAVSASVGSVVSEKDRIFRTVFSHMKNCSLGDDVPYQDWLKATSFYDAETLYFGMYCMTFPDSNPLDVTCGTCGKVNKLEVSNASLVCRPPKETYDRAQAVLAGQIRPGSSVPRLWKLPDSGLIVTLRSPSLNDYMDLLRNSTQEQQRNFRAVTGMMLFCDGIKVPDPESSKRLGKEAYVELPRDQWFDALAGLGRADGAAVSSRVDELMDTHRIQYAIKSTKCGHCKAPVEEIPVSMEQVLFIRIVRETGD